MDYTNKNQNDSLTWLKNNLDNKRFEHSIGTAECAKELAQMFGQNIEKAYVAGLLHDCAKCFSNEKLIEIIEKHIPDVSDDEKASYKTLHAPVSSHICKTEFGVQDSEILSAIRWHTIGKVNMSEFEKIIFLADKIETRTRKPEYREKISAYVYEEKNLDKALLECYKLTIKSLCDRNLRICPLTIEIYNNLQHILNVN